MNLIDEFDCVVWAREFCKSNSCANEQEMKRWFATALMAGYNFALKQRDKEEESEKP